MIKSLIFFFLFISTLVSAQSVEELMKLPNRSLDSLASVYYQQGAFEKAIPAMHAAKNNIQKEFGKRHKDYVVYCSNIGFFYMQAGLYEKAEPFYLEALEVQQKLTPKKQAEYAVSLDNLANLYKASEQYKESEKRYIQSKKIYAKTFGTEHPQYAQGLLNLANLYYPMRKLNESAGLYEEAKEIRLKHFGEISGEYAICLYNLGALNADLEEYSKAEEYYTKTAEIYSKFLGENSAQYAQIAGLLADLHEKTGNYKEADFYYKKIIKIFKNIYGEGHHVHIKAMTNMARMYYNLGDYGKAIEIYTEVELIEGKKMDMNDSERAATQLNLGTCYLSMGNFEIAERLFLEVEKKFLKFYGAHHKSYALLLNNLAGLYVEQGMHEKAEPLYLQPMQIFKQIEGEENVDYARCLVNLGVLYTSLGIYDKAELMHHQAIKIRKKILGEKHADYAKSLNNLAGVYTEEGKNDKALVLYIEALEILKNSLGKEHPEYARCLINLAVIYHEENDDEKAKTHYLQAKTILEKSVDESHSLYTTLIYNLACFYEDIRRYKEAETYFKRVLAIRTKNLMPDNLNIALVQSAMGELYRNMGAYEQGEKLYKQALEIHKKNLIDNFSWLSEKDKAAYWAKNKYFFQALSDFSAISTGNLKSASVLAYQGNIIQKALLLETSRDLEDAVVNSKDPDVKNIFNQLKDCRRQLAKLESGNSVKKELLGELMQYADSLDRVLVGKLGIYALSKHKFEMTWNEIQKGLKDNEASIEFARYRDLTTGEFYYMGLVLRKGLDYPHLVKLGQEKAIKEVPPAKGFATLYKLIWEPMDSLLKGVTTIYYSPEGYLNNIAFSALCIKGTEKDSLSDGIGRGDGSKTVVKIWDYEYLSERYTLHQLSTTRYLAEDTKEINIANSLLVFGGIDFDNIPNLDSSAISVPNYHTSTGVRGTVNSNSIRMEYLPGTKKEIENLEDILVNSNWKVASYSENKASEHNFKSEVAKQSTAVLHIATHGFAFPDRPIKENHIEIENSTSFVNSDNPMARCGLLFAGANHSWVGNPDTVLANTGEDGILTALEVANLPLRNTKLVVLSACETGLGKVEGTEGVFGLKRGFKLAGVEQIIVSLWSVPDKETMELMSLFYGDLVKSKDVAVSFEKAQTAMRKKYADRPDLWAGFVLVR